MSCWRHKHQQVDGGGESGVMVEFQDQNAKGRRVL